MSELRPAAGLPLTAIIRHSGEVFRAVVAELPEVQVRGDTLAGTLKNLKQSIVLFLTTNRQRAFRDIADDAVTEIVVLEVSAELTSERAVTVTDKLRLQIPVRVQFGPSDAEHVRNLFDPSIIVRVVFDTETLSDVLHGLSAAQSPTGKRV